MTTVKTENLLERLKSLEARIYAADAHEAPKYVAQLQEELYEAWPKLATFIEVMQRLPKEIFIHPLMVEAGDALAALETER